MGLFSKKTCSICGGEIKFLGNKKLADGDMCKECAGKLSVYFDERKHSTIEQIKKQLEDREENRKKLNDFKPNYIFGESGVILIDKENKCFTALPYTSERLFGNNKEVHSIEDIIDRNPDIIKFDQVKDFEIDQTVNSREEKHTVNGEQVSYNPKHYTYMCGFTLRMQIDHPYINSIYIPLEKNSIHIYCEEPRKVLTYADKFKSHFKELPKGIVDYENTEKYYTNDSLMDRLLRTEYNLPDYSYGFKVNKIKNWKQIQEYHYYLLMCREIQEIIQNG